MPKNKIGQSKFVGVEINQEARAKRTSKQQVEVLDKRLGSGLGASKERKRLAKLIEKGK